MSRARIRSHVIRLLVLLGLAYLAGSSVEAVATTNPLDAVNSATPGPVLTGAACAGEGKGVLMVTGEQFTPGGEVDVAVFVSGDDHPAVRRSIRASHSILGPNGGTDPARGFKQGGFVGLALGPWCQEATAVRAYDRQKGAWSNEVGIDLGCEAVQ